LELAAAYANRAKFEALTSPGALELYKFGNSYKDMENIYNVNPAKFEALTSPGALELYKFGNSYKDMENIYDDDPAKFAALASPGAIEFYELGNSYKNMEDIYNVNPARFAVLTSPGAIESYKRGNSYKNMAELYIEDRKKAVALTSAGALAAYKAGAFYSDLNLLYDDTWAAFMALTSPGALALYKRGNSYDTLKTIYLSNPSGFATVIRFDGAGLLYELGGTVADLLRFYDRMHFPQVPAERRPAKCLVEFNRLKSALTSDKAFNLYRWGVTVRELVDWYTTCSYYRNMPTAFSDLISAITSPEALSVYRVGGNVSKLAACYLKACKADVKPSVAHVKPSVAQVFGLLTSALTSVDAKKLYAVGCTASDLLELYLDHNLPGTPAFIGPLSLALTSEGAIAAYKAGIPHFRLGVAYIEDPAKFAALTSHPAIWLYKIGVRSDEAAADFGDIRGFLDEISQAFNDLESKPQLGHSGGVGKFIEKSIPAIEKVMTRLGHLANLPKIVDTVFQEVANHRENMLYPEVTRKYVWKIVERFAADQERIDKANNSISGRFFLATKKGPSYDAYKDQIIKKEDPNFVLPDWVESALRIAFETRNKGHRGPGILGI